MLFFNIVEKTDFLEEARQHGIDSVIFFITEDHPKSVATYRSLIDRISDATVVPVHNEIFESASATRRSHPLHNAIPIHVEPKPTLLFGVIQRPGFSISECRKRPSEFPTMLHNWVGRPFIAFSNLELRLPMTDLLPLFRLPA